MAEAVGLGASIVTLLAVAKTVKDILSGYRKGGEDRNRLLREVNRLADTLDRLRVDDEKAKKDGRYEAWLEHVRYLSKRGGTLDDIKDVMSEIELRIQPKKGFRGALLQMTWPFYKEDVDRNIQKMIGLSQNVSLALETASLKMTFTISGQVSQLHRIIDKGELRHVLAWLSPLNFLEQQSVEFSKAVLGTCDWFLSSPSYTEWKQREDGILHCSAIGGAGKTILASVTVDDLRIQTAGQDVGVFVIYCKHDRPDTQSAEKLARALLRQYVQMKAGRIPSDLEELLDRCYFNSIQKPQESEILKIVNANLKNFATNFIVVDGLDEILRDKDREQVIKFLVGLQGKTHVMFTSRPIDIIENTFIASDPLDEDARTSVKDDEILEEDDESWGDNGEGFGQSYTDDTDSVYCLSLQDLDSIESGDSSTDQSDVETDYELESREERDSTEVKTGNQIQNPPIPSRTSQQSKDGRACRRCRQKVGSLQYRCQKCIGFESIICKCCYDCGLRCVSGDSNHDTFLLLQIFSVKMDVSAHPKAIRTYVRRRIEQSPNLLRYFKSKADFRREIEEIVPLAAKKMFLMAQLHMDAISDTELLKFSEVRNALLSLPTRLNDSYDNAMERIQHHGKLLLKLVSYACRPLKIKEVEHALGMTPGNDEILDEEIVPASTLVSRCAGLVTLNESHEVVFSHYTVDNYFTTRRNELFENGQKYMTEICLHYLSLKEFRNGPVRGEEEGALFEARLTEYPFFEYASIFWGTHARACELGSALELASKFIRDHACRNASIQALWYSSEGATNHWRNRDTASPLHLAMYFKYAELANRLLEEGADSNFQDSFGMTTLMWAAQVADLEMAKKTIHMKVPLEAVNTHGESALYIAIEKGHEDVANLLIAEPLLDVNQPCKRGETQEITPLNFAIEREEVCIVQKLLSRDDISTNSIDKQGWSIVHWAAVVDDPRIMEAVVGIPGIDLNCPNHAGVPPLIAVAYNGNLASLVALLDAGANINVSEQEPGQRGTALMRAADDDCIAIVHELLKRCIDWEATDLENRNAVHSAAINGSLHSLSALLDVPKIDMNLQDVYGNTPMHDAAALSDPRALKILLDKGAHSKVPNHRGKTPLDMARAKGCKINVRILKDKYAEDFGMPRRCLTGMSLEEPTLIEAAQQGDKSAVNSILTAYEQDKSIDIEETDDWLRRTPLQHAVHCGSLSIVRKLHKAGASITVQDKYGRTPLHIAAMLDRYKIAGYLVSQGADPRVKDRWGVSAIDDAAGFLQVFFLEKDIKITPNQNREKLLFWAAWLGSMKALKCLVDAGVEVQVKDDYGHSPYEIARQNGQMEAAKYLDRVGKGTSTSATTSLPGGFIDQSDRAKTPIATAGSKSDNTNLEKTRNEKDDRTRKKDHESEIDHDTNNNSPVYGSIKTPAAEEEETVILLKRNTSKTEFKDSSPESSSQTFKAIGVSESSNTMVREFARKWLQAIIILFLLLVIYHLK